MAERTASLRTFRTRRARPGLRATALELVAAMLRELVDPYRPELHYMRGPGPKWHAKHRPQPVEAPAGGQLLPA